MNKLKKQLEDGFVETGAEESDEKRRGEGGAGGDILLTKLDRRTGLTMPVRSGEKKESALPTSRKVGSFWATYPFSLILVQFSSTSRRKLTLC